jgi:membrane associated rhomboid family serine protease
MMAMLVAASVAAASGQWLFVLFDQGEVLQQAMLREWLALSAETARAGHFWQFLTFALLHAGPFHLLGNMLVLYFAGREVEPIVGRQHFLGLYVLGNAVGGVTQWAAMAAGLAPADATLVGVSAGVAGVLVAFATILPQLEITVMLLFVIPLRMRVKTLGLATVVGSGALTLVPGAASVGPWAMLAASLVGWIYVRQLGFGQPLWVQRWLFERRQREARLARMPAGQFMDEEVDPILEKISRDGVGSLTRAERRILDRGREKLAAAGSAGRR